MKIIDILINGAELLGLKEEAKLLSEATEDNMDLVMTDDNISTLFRLVKFSIQELCTNYVPMVAREKIETADKTYAISNLKNFIRVQNIYRDNDPIKFKIINRNILFEEDGEYTIQYASYPEIESVYEDIDFLENFSPDAIIFGLCAYFSLARGLFEEFTSFHEKYLEKADSLRALRIFEMPTRRWE